ncbi:hypothetical protein pdam_00020318 [Pocillopora damicornis]|uniref:Uncharacterized protein n=1 Tax=Pocillopora damicornis TaxID=46731 RepID=A0A3M6T7U7_POCDA|nr:hypothetical protein pdam_00020318 [Pocillopora damicornis]
MSSAPKKDEQSLLHHGQSTMTSQGQSVMLCHKSVDWKMMESCEFPGKPTLAQMKRSCASTMAFRPPGGH